MADHKTERDYDALLAKIDALAPSVYLTDETVDAENVSLSREAIGYWGEMMDAARMAAGMRAEEAGLDLNALAGETIY